MTAKTHATLGASSAARWMACPASVRMSRELPQAEDHRSFYARQGSAAHWVAEECLRNGLDAIVYVGAKYEGVTVDRDMAACVQVFIDKAREIVPDVEPLVEVQFSLDRLNPPEDMFGTADVVKYDGVANHLYVLDYKHGAGVAVDAEGNPQLLYYALGACLSLDVAPDKVTVGIIQPRASHPKGSVRLHTYSWDEVVTFKNNLIAAAHRTLDPAADLHVGSWCRFCPAQAICPAQHDFAVTLAQQEFEAMEPVTLPAPETLTEEQIAEVLEKTELVTSWLRAVEKYAHDKLEDGEPVAGWKLVEKKANRTWRDEEETLRTLLSIPGVDMEDCAVTKIISPRQAELMLRRFGATLPEGLTKRESSGYNMVRESDPRPEAIVQRGEEFFLNESE